MQQRGIIDSFRQAMLDAGIGCDADIIDDGVLHRFTVAGDKPRSLNGWYVLFPDGIPAGEFGSWKTGQTVTWCSRERNTLTSAELNDIDKRRKESAAIREAEQEAKHEAAAQLANEIWSASQPASSEYPYLVNKGVQPCGARCTDRFPNVDGQVLIIPIRKDKRIVSLQAIMADGQKRFLAGGEKKGCYSTIGKIGKTIAICEGFSTGSSIHQATGFAVVVALDAGNLLPVSVAMREKFPDAEFVICADRDENCTGENAARKCEMAINARVAVPKFQDPSPDKTDFNDLHRYEGIDAVRDQVNPKKHVEKIPQHMAVNYIEFLPDINDKGKPLTTIENLVEICNRLGVVVRYNVISKEIEILTPDSRYSVDNHANASIAWVMSECAKFKYATDKVMQFMTEIADHNQFNPVKNWIESKAWDGVDRLKALSDSLGSNNPELTYLLLTKWMTGAIEAAYSPTGVDNSSVLVLQGAQNAGKTSWFWALTNYNRDIAKESIILNPADKDSVMGATSVWLAELGELDATLKKADIAALKAFITKSTDSLRKPYAVSISTYPRRTVFFASVNELKFLNDDTNRRFWTIECGSKLNPRHGIDVQQCWAQVLELYNAGATWKLTKPELEALNEHNENYRAQDPIEERILSCFDPEDEFRNKWLTASDILLAIGYSQPNKAQQKTAGAALRKYFGSPRRVSGKSCFNMPIKKVDL